MKNIRLTTNRTIDFHSLKSIAASIIKPGMGGEQKALACYNVVRHYMFHYPWVYNEQPRREEWHDAVKLLRTYGHGLCGVQARTLGALYQEVFGFENQRLTGAIEKEVGDWAMGEQCGAFYFSLQKRTNSLARRQGHTTVEVFYDGHWHHLDPMAEFYTYSRDGSRIASLAETFADPSLVIQPSRPIKGLMPDGDIGKVYYASTLPSNWNPGPGYYVVRDTQMDVALKPGQRIRWFWDKPYKTFFWPELIAKDFPQPYFAEGPRHPDPSQSRWRHYGNGCFNAHQTTVSSPTQLQFDLPYVLVGGRLLLSAAGTDLCLDVRSKGVEAGEPLRLKAGLNTIDLRTKVMGGYGLDLLFEGTGTIRDLQLELYFQHNFMAAPRLMEGNNQIQIRGQAEQVGEGLEVIWEWREAEAQEKRHLRQVALPEEYEIEVGALAADPPENPKYMKSLTLQALKR
jgi:hypothetical protein